MATVDDVRRIALALPGTAERESRGDLDWRVADKSFVWERPLRKGDSAALGDRAPHVQDLTELISDAWLARAPKKLAAAFLARQWSACAPATDAGDLTGGA